MEELKEEVDEARKLAEEWEAKYKEMQRQMSLLEEGTPFGKKNSTTGFEKPVLQRGLSTTSSGMLGSTLICQKLHEMIMIYKSKFQENAIILQFPGCYLDVVLDLCMGSSC